VPGLTGRTRPRLQRPCAGLRVACVAYVACAASVAGCKSWSPGEIQLPGVTPYRIEIQQGNYVSQDMIAKLRRGMSREQVRFVLGTPLVADMFHADRWDYVFYRETPGKPRESRRVSVLFKNDRLESVEGDVVSQAAGGKAPEVRAVDGPAQETPEARAIDGAAQR